MTIRIFVDEGQRYHATVTALMFNRAAQVLVGHCELKRHKKCELIQGGWEDHEPLRNAFFREVREEAGLRQEDVFFIAASREFPAYSAPFSLSWGKQGRTQLSCAAFLLKDGVSPTVTAEPDGEPQEFSAMDWVDLPQIPELCVGYKRETYRKIVEAFLPVTTAIREICGQPDSENLVYAVRDTAALRKSKALTLNMPSAFPGQPLQATL
ncbi:MAG: NUDIX domain-containing protein [Alphaproteobacteria bacterium]|nr:NUDIX domain-containing protein [Alphaproteobacteria bacterium]